MKCVCSGCTPCYIGVPLIFMDMQPGVICFSLQVLLNHIAAIVLCVPKTCRAKNISIKLPCCSKFAFHIIALRSLHISRASYLMTGPR